MFAEPYHPLGMSKSQQLSKTQTYQNNDFWDLTTLKPFADILMTKTDKEVVII
ncbi:MAG: hypothetical protein IIX60_04955 [Clostridia bacterium]|nr:hypothetical protein [Clostridia bacterium]